MPQWLLVAMHHSGLFDDWRMPIATGVAWFHDPARGGEFAYYPNGADGGVVAHGVHADSALVLDTDSVFHGVDRVASTVEDMAPLRPGMTLDFTGDGTWAVHDGGDELVRYRWDELRFSVSWKAYCFADEDEQRTWRDHVDDLSLDMIVDRLVADLRARGRIDGDAPGNPDLALMIIDEYIRFPASVSDG
jgi:hypothetical protein